jgi:hypothetical protein
MCDIMINGEIEEMMEGIGNNLQTKTSHFPSRSIHCGKPSKKIPGKE